MQRHTVPLAAATLLAAGCGEYPCADARLSEQLGGAGLSFAYHLRVDADIVGGYYDGTVINRSATVDCTIALYRFFSEPSPDVLPALAAGDIAPEELPGGGVLVEQRHLLADRGREYRVRIGGWDPSFGLNPEPPHDEWLVGTTCPGAQLELSLYLNATACNDEDVRPSTSSPWIERVW